MKTYAKARGFTLVELMTTILLVSVLMSFGIATFNSVVRDTRFKREVAEIDGLLRKTKSECLARGSAGRVVVGTMDDDNDDSDTDLTIRGFYFDNDNNLVEIARYELDGSKFARNSSAATPWLKHTDTGQASSFADDRVLITATGMVETAGSVYITNGDDEAVIEVLANGSVDTFYYHGRNDEGDIWTR